MSGDVRALEASILACQEAQAQFKEQGSFRTRVLFDMLLLEMSKELAVALGKDPTAFKRSDVEDDSQQT